MDPLLRAAVERREREQALGAETEFDFVAADEQRMRLLNELAHPRCAACGRPKLETSIKSFCSRPDCRKARRDAARAAKGKPAFNCRCGRRMRRDRGTYWCTNAACTKG